MIETNFEKVAKQLETIGNRLYKKVAKQPTEIRNIFNEFGRKTRNCIVYSMLLDPKTGHIYKYKKESYRASAPGESPAIRSSKLVRAISYTVGKYQMEIGALKRANYAKYLEPETAAGLRNRPFLKINVDRNVPYVKKEIINRIFVIKKGAGFV